MMLAHRPVMLAISPALRVDGVNWVSVMAKPPLVGAACSVVRYAVVPFASEPPAVAAELLQLVPVPVPPASVARSFIVTEAGTRPVRVFEVRSAFTPRWTVCPGVTRHEQHEINSSDGSNAYALTQMLPAAAPRPGPRGEAPFVPALPMSRYDSPKFRLAE